MKKNKALPERDAPGTAAVKKSAKKTVLHTIIPAVLCVLGAFALWLYVMQTESPTYTDTVADIEVKLEGVEELADKTGLSVYSGEGSTVSVSVSGKKSLIARLAPGDVGATVDVSQITAAGKHALPVVIDLPSGLTLAEPVSDTVTVYADETVSKSVPVKEKLTGLELPADYTLGQIQLGFDTVTVEGPAGKVNGITEAQVAVDMAGKTSSFSAKYPITFTDSLGSAVTMDYLKCSASEIDVSVPVYQTAELTVPYRFKYDLLPEDSVTVTITPSVLTVTGDEKDVTSESAITPVVIDEKTITSNSFSFKTTPEISSNLTLDSGSAEVSVSVVIDPTVITRDVAVKDIKITGADPSVKCEVIDTSVTVTLRGTKEQLDAAEKGNIYLNVDMTGYEAGSAGTVTRPATVVVEANDAAGVFEIGSYTVQIKVS